MTELSISQAWEGTKASIAADGKLMAVVAAALVALPGLIGAVIVPQTAGTESSLTSTIVILVTSLLALIGQLAIIRLAVTPAVSVGEAIAHGARRMPIYLVAGILLTIGFVIAMIPFALILYAAGVPLDRTNELATVASPVTLVLALLYLMLVIFICVRMLMTSPVASEEEAGPVQIIRRSWELTRGHWWRLFGFILIFFLGAGVVIAVVNWVISFVAVMLLGPIEPMSASALVVALVDCCVNATVTLLLAVMLARIYLQLVGRESLAVGVPRSGI
jgi:uncharacterized membrane protein